MTLREAQIEAAWRLHALRTKADRPGARIYWATIWPELRPTLAEAQGWRCPYCGVRMTDERRRQHSATLEHVVPLVLGGEDHPDNLVAACHACNQARGARPVRVDGEVWGLPGGPVPCDAGDRA